MAVDNDFVALSQLEETSGLEDAEDPIDVTVGIVYSPSEGRPIPQDPLPTMRTIRMPANGVAVLLEEFKPYRRQVTVVQFSNAIILDLSYDQYFRAPNFVRSSNDLFLVPLFPGQRLWARQNTATNQDISVLVEPRASGR